MIRDLIRSFLGIGFLGKSRECGALTIIGGIAGLQRGVEVAQTAVSVSSFSVRYFPRINESLPSNLGETIGRVVSTLASREITIEGEVLAATELMAVTFVAATTALTNDVADIGSPTGGIYLQEATVTQSRADWKKVSMRFESDPTLA